MKILKISISLIYQFYFFRPAFIHWFIQHLFIYSLINSFFYSLIHWLLINSFIHLSILLFIHTCIHSFIIHEFFHVLINQFIHSFIHSFIHQRIFNDVVISLDCLLVWWFGATVRSYFVFYHRQEFLKQYSKALRFDFVFCHRIRLKWQYAGETFFTSS